MYHRVKLAYILPPKESQQMQCHQRKVITGHKGNLKNVDNLNMIKTPYKKKGNHNLKNEDALKNEDTPKIKMTSKIKTSSKMMIIIYSGKQIKDKV